jgi:hypothetical protein
VGAGVLAQPLLERDFGRCAPSTGIDPCMALVTQVMTQQPYASATRVFWIVDTGSTGTSSRPPHPPSRRLRDQP